MKTIKMTFDDGDTSITRINGSYDDIRAHYIGKLFIKHECEETGKEIKHMAIGFEEITE